MGRSPRRSSQVVEGLNRGAWTSIEDKTLIDYVKSHGEGKWSNVFKVTGLRRCGKSCRLRWMNYLRPDIKRGNISVDEEELILRLHKLLGNRWALIAGRLPGRTDNEVKNYWNTHLAKKAQDQTLSSPQNMTPLITGMPSNACPPQVPLRPASEHQNNDYDQSSMLNVSLFPNAMVNDTKQPESSDRSSPLTGQDFVMDFNIDDIYQILDPGFAGLNGVVLSDLNMNEHAKPGTGTGMGSDMDLRSLASFLESEEWLADEEHVNVTCKDEAAGR